NAACGFGNQVVHQRVQHALQRFVEDELFRRVRIFRQHGRVEALEKLDSGAGRGERQNSRLEAVVEVGGGVGDFVSQVDQLRFERRELVEEILGQLRILGGGVIVGVLD